MRVSRCIYQRRDQVTEISLNNHFPSHAKLHRGRQTNAWNPYVKVGDMDCSDIPKLLEAYLDSSKEHLDSCTDYFSPFREQDVGFDLHEGEGASVDEGDTESRDRIGVGKDIRNDEVVSGEEVDVGRVQGIDPDSTANVSSESFSESLFGVGGPTGYGNCLLAIRCRCQYCNGRSSPASFVVHPVGDNLSSLAISKLSLPRSSPCRGGQQRREVDIGGRVLQISRCGAARTMDSSNSFCIVARTSQYCSVIYVKSTMNASVLEGECPIEYQMREETRIDLRTPSASIHPSYLPVCLSCDPKSTDSCFTFPTFAIISRDCAGESTTIHRVVLRRETVVKGHSLSSSLSDISLIEFCSDDRMAIWAAARSRVMPKLSTGFSNRGTVTGYGHSLFRINLRDDSSSLVWSPSHAEFITEGLHSINGIMADKTNEHVVWVSSSSACKAWALDVRYKLAKVVVRWSLPLLSDDFGSQLSLTGIYGAGVMMSQPISTSTYSNRNRDASIQNIQPSPMFSLKKDPNSNALCMYQFPCARPRLGTQPLESVGFQYIPKTYDASSIARSAIFPLPDAAGSIFNVGLAAFHYSSKTCLSNKQLGHLCHQTKPANVIYVITMTSIGDLYCHSLLETNGADETQARQFHGLPVGTKAIPVPGDVEVKTSNTGNLSVSLSNEFPIPSNALTPYIVREAGDCCTYKSYDIGDILSRKPQTNLPLQESCDHDKCAAGDSIADQAADSKSPFAAYDSVNSNAATKEAAFNCSSSNDNITSGLAYRGLHKSEEISNSSVSVRYSVEHSTPKFGVVFSSESPKPSSQVVDSPAAAIGGHPQPITSAFHQTVVVTHIDRDAMEYDPVDDLGRGIDAYGKHRNNEMDLGLITKLKSGYYFNEKADTGHQIGVKSEWCSDDE